MEYFAQGNLYFNLSTASQAQRSVNNTDKHHLWYVITYRSLFYFNIYIYIYIYIYRVSFIILYNDQQMHGYFTNYHTPTCFDTIVSSSGSL